MAVLIESAADRVPAARVSRAGMSLDVVPVHVVHAVAVGPLLLAGQRARVATDALVEIHHHRVLMFDIELSLHWAL